MGVQVFGLRIAMMTLATVLVIGMAVSIA